MNENVDRIDVQEFADFLAANKAPYEIFYLTGRETFIKGIRYVIKEEPVSYSYMPVSRIMTDAAKFLDHKKTQYPIGVHSIELRHDEDLVYLSFALGEKLEK